MSDNGTSRSAPRRGALLWLVGRRRGKCVGEVWIPTPVCTPRALASRHVLARNDSALRCGAMWASPPTRSRGVRAKGRPPLRSGTSRTPSPTGRDVEDTVPYRAGRRGAGHTKGIKKEAPAGVSFFMRSSLCVLGLFQGDDDAGGDEHCADDAHEGDLLIQQEVAHHQRDEGGGVQVVVGDDHA